MSKFGQPHGNALTFDHDSLRHQYLISAFNGRQDTIEHLNEIGIDEIVLSAFTVMELYQGMDNKEELAWMKKNIRYYDVVQIDEEISKKAVEFIETYKLSHGLLIPDAIIGATSVVHQIPLYTYNLRDFNFLPDIVLYRPA